MGQEAIDADNAKVTEAEKTKHEYEVNVKAAEAVLAARTEEVIAKEMAVDRASQAVLDAINQATSAQSAQSTQDASLVELKKDKKMVLDALDEHVRVLKEDDA